MSLVAPVPPSCMASDPLRSPALVYRGYLRHTVEISRKHIAQLGASQDMKDVMIDVLIR